MADLLGLLQSQAIDLTSGFRSLSAVVRGAAEPARDLYPDRDAFDAWSERWLARLDLEASDAASVADAMDQVNPVYIPRNHLVEEALAAATAGDLGPFVALVDVLRSPFTERPGLERYAEPGPAGQAYQTFCGT